jgi:hypothetical protein
MLRADQQPARPAPPTDRGQRGARDEKLHRLLQELAWEAIIKEPLSGVKAEP